MYPSTDSNFVSKDNYFRGLIIDNISLKNKTLLAKWLWRFPLEKESYGTLLFKAFMESMAMGGTLGSYYGDLEKSLEMHF